MNKRSCLIIATTGVILLLLILVIGSITPLWTRLGVKPYCIQGELPRLKIVPCDKQSANRPTPTPLAAQGLITGTRIPVIFDDDGSPDGMIALLYFLNNPQYDVRAVTISNGEAHPDLFANHILKLLAGLGKGEIPVGAGRPDPLTGNNAFPDPWRQASDNFWDLELPATKVSTEPASAAELMVDTINTSPEPVLIFVSGTHTNLAEALRLDSRIKDNIRDIYIMGGSIYEDGNINSDWPAIDNRVAEWNIWVDPMAASEVFESGLPLHLIPLDATKKVSWNQSDIAGWSSTRSPSGEMASKLLRWMLDSWSAGGVYIWDLVAAVQATYPAVCPEVELGLDVVTDQGPEQGRTIINQGDPKLLVCLNPDIGQIKSISEFILGH